MSRTGKLVAWPGARMVEMRSKEGRLGRAGFSGAGK